MVNWPLIIGSIVVLFLVIVGVLVWALVDWRGMAIRWVGDNPDYGLAYVKIGGKWRYRESEVDKKLLKSWTFTRYEGDKKHEKKVTDRVPIEIIQNAEFDEYTGRLLYRINEGSAVAKPYTVQGEDCGDNYPSRLISSDLLAEVAVYLNESVKGLKKPFDWKPLAIIVGGVVVILIILAMSGVLHGPRPVPAPGSSANTTAAAPAGSVTFTPGNNPGQGGQ